MFTLRLLLTEFQTLVLKHGCKWPLGENTGVDTGGEQFKAIKEEGSLKM
jgi:hypothetical protein